MNHTRAESNCARYMLACGADDAPALLFRDCVMTYRELRAEVEKLAAALQRAGAVKGARIGLLCDNVPFFVVSYLAIMRAGLCAVPITAGGTPAMVRYVIETTGMRLALLQAKYAEATRQWAGDLPLRLWANEPCVLSTGEEVPAAAAQPGEAEELREAAVDPRKDPAVIMFTSGSTGHPKGVMVSHRNIIANTDDIIAYMGLTASDRVLAVLPLSYCFGASLLHTHLRAGGSVVLSASFMFPEKVLDEMARHACTGFAGVPSTFQILLRRTTFPRRSLPHLRWMQQAGGKLPNPYIQELRAAHPHARYFLMYGQTEATARLSYLPPEMLDRKLGSIGRGLPSTRLEVLRPDGTPVSPGSEEIGEIVASGDNITLGYWGDEEETRRYFKDGTLHTGDLARVDKDGYIFVVDRARDFIKSAGNRVSAKEVEDVISEHPHVVHVAVIGVPDGLLGEVVLAAVVARHPSALSADCVKAFCNARLPNYAVPQHVLIVSELPMNPYGKVLKEALRKQWTECNPPPA